MQILSFYFLLSQNFNSIKHAQLGNVEQDLLHVGLALLNWVEAQIELSKKLKHTYVLELANFCNFVLRKVEETEGVNVFKATQERNLILR